ncbi:MAG: sensor histidine kinase [Pirellulaceae bacterium]
MDRRSLKWPITLGVTMIVLLVALTVGWVLLAVFGALTDRSFAPLYWTLLTIGTTFLVLVLVGVVMYLALTVKAINLTRRQSNFIDSVTHELKSPIASLKLYLQTLNRHQVTEAERENFVRFMLEDVERLDSLTNHMLDAAGLDRVAKESEIESIRLDHLLRQCVEEVRLRYRTSADAVHVKVQPSRVSARNVDLNMIFRNLVDNAIKYAGDPPWVEILSQPDDDGTVVTLVYDNGRGIPRQSRRKIFRRFVRLGVELKREKPGTGLGLYIVHTLVQRLGGSVHVHDRDPGPGTVFEVRLPGTGCDDSIENRDHPRNGSRITSPSPLPSRGRG